MATLLIDLLTSEEERVDRATAHLRFDIPLLAGRLAGAASWLRSQPETAHLRIGFFGASTGAGAALIAAAELPDIVGAVVSRGGRPDLAGEALRQVRAPTLLIVGGRDTPVIEMNEDALAMIETEKRLEIVPGASHLFEEPGTLEQVEALAAEWFTRHLSSSSPPVHHTEPRPSGDESDSGQGSVEDRREAATRSAVGSGSAAGSPAATVGTGSPADSEAAAGGNGRTGDPSPPSPAGRVFRRPKELARLVADSAEAFGEIEETDLTSLLDRIGDSTLVLIGEASHGTSEFYRMRQQITRALIEQKGFNVIGVEADWPDAEHVDEYVRGRRGKAERADQAFARFPDWMWRNHEVLEFVEWLRSYNEPRPSDQRVGFYGLDVYSLYASIREVLRFVSDVDPELASSVRKRYDCLMPFAADPGLYGDAVITNRYKDCETEVLGVLSDLLERRMELTEADGERYFDAAQNARVVSGAEQYYRLMYYGAPESWNHRDRHMFETLQSILEFRGPGSKAVIWAHNSHIGNAAATEMAARGETNIGRLSREAFGDDAYLIGFGTHEGTVAAASFWGGDVNIKKVRPSHPKSYEHLCHESGVDRFLLPLRHPDHHDLRPELSEPRLQRAIGVIYRPDTELRSHYFQAILPDQFDEYVWFDWSEAVRPFEHSTAPELPERHPFLLAD